jgi:uncharacterized protein (TIGR02594 family)
MEYTYEDKIAFIKKLYCAARVVSAETGMSWELILAQAALECGWGEKVLAGTNNLFNIKADSGWQGEKRVFHVPEQDSHGRIYYENAPFRVYANFEESLRDRTEFLKKNPRYAKAGLFDEGVKGNLSGEAAALRKAGYATDKDYVTKLEKIFGGRTMQRSIKAAQKEGCKGCLPVVEVTLKTGANLEMANAKVLVVQNKKTAEVTTGPSGTFVVQAPPNSGDIILKLFDEIKKAWIDLEPIKMPELAKSIAATIIAPTFVVATSTRQHEKKPVPAGAKPTPKPAPPSPAPASANFTLYPIKKGDSLSSIGAAHGISYHAIAAMNNIKSPYHIRPDQVLKIPKKAAAKTEVPAPAAKPVPITGHAAPPAEDAPAPIRSAPVLPTPAAALDTIYFRSQSGHPKTEAMLALRAPWMKFAEEEFQKGVKRRAGRAHDPRILEYLSATNLGGTDKGRDETPYCAAFCNWTLVKGGYRGIAGARALDYARWGRSTKDNKPALGAVAVIRFPGTTKHHVTFVAGMNNGGVSLATLGGNQGDANAVTHSTLPKVWVIAYRYPADYPHYDEDYVLHHVQSSSGPVTAAGTR